MPRAASLSVRTDWPIAAENGRRGIQPCLKITVYCRHSKNTGDKGQDGPKVNADFEWQTGIENPTTFPQETQINVLSAIVWLHTAVEKTLDGAKYEVPQTR